MVIGNKCDVPQNERQVDQDMLKELESKEKVNVIEVSAKDDINVNETFVKLVEQMLKLGLEKKKQSSGADDKNITIKGDNNRKNNNGGCCKR